MEVNSITYIGKVGTVTGRMVGVGMSDDSIQRN